MEQILLYALVAVAVIVGFLSLFGRRGPEAYEPDREDGWERLPNVFKLVWGMATACESSVGAYLSLLLPKRAAGLAETIPPSALPLTPARVLASSLLLGVMFGFVGLLAAAVASVAMPDVPILLLAGIAVFLPLIGWFWPSQNLRAYAERRQTELVRQLPFAIDLVSSAMRSGLEFGAGDRHNGGRCVIIFTTDAGKFVYKPHTLAASGSAGRFLRSFRASSTTFRSASPSPRH